MIETIIWGTGESSYQGGGHAGRSRGLFVASTFNGIRLSPISVRGKTIETCSIELPSRVVSQFMDVLAKTDPQMAIRLRMLREQEVVAAIGHNLPPARQPHEKIARMQEVYSSVMAVARDTLKKPLATLPYVLGAIMNDSPGVELHTNARTNDEVWLAETLRDIFPANHFIWEYVKVV